MAEQRANLQKSVNDEDTGNTDTKIKALFMDLYDYFRMDSSMDPIILFENLCCVLIQFPDQTGILDFDKISADPVSRYYTLIEQFRSSGRNAQVRPDVSVFSNRSQLIHRLMDTAVGVWELTRDKRRLVPLLFDFLETILQARRGETIGTPLQTAREIVNLAAQTNPSIFFTEMLDPACGSGAFLLAMLEQADKNNRFFFSCIEGLERDEHLRNCVLLMSCLYDSFGSAVKVTVKDGGSPIQIGENKYDLILANPPFRTQSLRDRDAVGDSLELPVPTKDIHRAFLQRTLLGLRCGGQSAIIVPDSFLTHTGSDAIRVRSWIVENFQCMGIIKLPAYTFYPQAAVNASILFLYKPYSYDHNQPNKSGIFFFTVEVDGRSNDPRRRPLLRNDFDELRQVWEQRETLWQEWSEEARTQNVYGMDVPVQWNHPHFWFGRLEDVRSSDYSLLPEQYQPVRLSGEPVQDPKEILAELQKVGREIMELTQRLAEAEYDR